MLENLRLEGINNTQRQKEQEILITKQTELQILEAQLEQEEVEHNRLMKMRKVDIITTQRKIEVKEVELQGRQLNLKQIKEENRKMGD